MAIHIHVYAGKKTKDAQAHAPAGSSKGGQFVTTGSAGGSASHHQARHEAHQAEAKKKGSGHADFNTHLQASGAHQAAASQLIGASQGYKGQKEAAQRSANAASKYEAKLKK